MKESQIWLEIDLAYFLYRYNLLKSIEVKLSKFSGQDNYLLMVSRSVGFW